MLDFEHTGRKRVGRIAGEHRYTFLFNDWTCIEFGHHEVHRCAMLCCARRKRAFVGVKPFERWQQ